MDDVLNAYIYELKKGTKPIALITGSSSLREKYCEKIRKNNLACCIQNIGCKDNIFFGSKECIDIISLFLRKKLSKLTPEQDFILGIMLGYNRIEQCKRYLNKLNYTLSTNS